MTTTEIVGACWFLFCAGACIVMAFINWPWLFAAGLILVSICACSGGPSQKGA